MRTIKFRGKSLATGEWLHGSLFIDGAEDYILPNLPSGAIDYESYQVDQNTVGQFTGLLDKNGQAIYEGDIATDGINVYTAKFSLWSCAYMWDKHGSHNDFHFEKNDDNQEMELIGNIYDNPELLNMCRMIK